MLRLRLRLRYLRLAVHEFVDYLLVWEQDPMDAEIKRLRQWEFMQESLDIAIPFYARFRAFLCRIRKCPDCGVRGPDCDCIPF